MAADATYKKLKDMHRQDEAKRDPGLLALYDLFGMERELRELGADAAISTSL